MRVNFRVTSWVAMAMVASTAQVRAEDQEPRLETCARNFGTLMIVEPNTGWARLSQYGLGNPASLLRMMIQKTGCFDVVERGAGLKMMDAERARMQSGDLRGESNVGAGQMQAADFVMVPDVQIPTSTTGGIGGGLLGGRLGLLGAVIGGLKFSEANTSLLLSDVRSGIQITGAEGKAKQTNFSLGGFLGGAAAGGFTSTPEGKVVAASFLDNLNKIVVEIRDKESLVRKSSQASDTNAAGSTKAEKPIPAGQVLQPKIANVKVYADASRDSKVNGTLAKGEDVVATGETKEGFVMIEGSNVTGWVQRALMQPH